MDRVENKGPKLDREIFNQALRLTERHRDLVQGFLYDTPKAALTAKKKHHVVRDLTKLPGLQTVWSAFGDDDDYDRLHAAMVLEMEAYQNSILDAEYDRLCAQKLAGCGDSLFDQLTAANDRIAELEAALKPFAEVYEREKWMVSHHINRTEDEAKQGYTPNAASTHWRHFDTAAKAMSEAKIIGFDPVAHEWVDGPKFQVATRTLTYCRVCGLVKRRDGKNKPCRGRSKISLRRLSEKPSK